MTYAAIAVGGLVLLVGVFAFAMRDRASGDLLRVAHLAISLLTAVLFLIVLTRPLGDSSPQPTVFEPSEESLQQEAARSGLPTGDLAPGLANSAGLGLVDADGRPFSLAQYRGRAVWIVIWATYCEACKLEEPDLIATYRAHAADGLVVVAVDLGEPPEDVRTYVRTHRLPYPVAIDQKGAARRAYGAIGTPTHFFVGRDGAIRERAFGRMTRDEMAARVSSIHDSGRPASSGGPERHGRVGRSPRAFLA